MNFLQALSSDKPFRRQGMVYFIHKVETALYWNADLNNPAHFGATIDDLAIEDLLAEDWELKEDQVTITRSQADHALKIARDGVGNWNDDYYAFMTTLGFDPKVEE